MKTNLQKLRKAAGYDSAKAFAEAHGIPVSTYTGHEQGTRKLRIDVAWKYADIFDVSLDELAGRHFEQKEYTDPLQERLNKDFELLDDRGKDAAVGAVAGIAAVYTAGTGAEGYENNQKGA